MLIIFIQSGLSAEKGALRLLPQLHQPASYVLGLLPLGAVILINRLYRSHGLRRGIGTIWDVATFWPRWFHPWAPPSYGERAIPQLRARIRVLTNSGSVIVSAHSQGTVITLAALATMIDDSDSSKLDRVTLLTHGSPLKRLYARFFPEYFDQNLFKVINDALKRSENDGRGPPKPTTTWYNLHRSTDFIGGELFDPPFPGVEDVYFLDPETPRPPAEGERAPQILGHSYYYRQEAYSRIVLGIVGSGSQERAPNRPVDIGDVTSGTNRTAGDLANEEEKPSGV